MTAPVSSFTPGPICETAAARVAYATPCGRLSLRARGDLAPLNTALGLTLPSRIGTRASAGGVEAICLGPDEWTLQCPASDVARLLTACAAVTLPHSLVDISGREITFEIDGTRAADLLTLGCPRDIDTIPASEGRRTLFDGVAVILWRDSDTSFRMDIWHSFALHLLHLLETGCRELAAEVH